MSRLAIYVSQGCAGCERAHQIAASLQGAYPGVAVDIVDLKRTPPDAVPEEVMAVPTYILDGVVVSLGNPNVATLREQLAALVLRG